MSVLRGQGGISIIIWLWFWPRPWPQPCLCACGFGLDSAIVHNWSCYHHTSYDAIITFIVLFLILVLTLVLNNWPCPQSGPRSSGHGLHLVAVLKLVLAH